MKPFFIVTIIFFIASCKDDVQNTTVPSSAEMFRAYFPLDTGRYIIYDVDSTVHSEIDDMTNEPDTSIFYFRYQIMEHIDSAFVDGQGDNAYRVSRFKRDNDTLPWDFINVWVSKLTPQSAQRDEDNLRYVKLSFPFNINSTWNGNAFNYLPGEDYSYSEINSPLSISSFNFDSSLTVLQFEDINLIHRIYKEEKYANHVGMVYKQKDSLNVNAIGSITNGIEFKMTLNSYGH